MAELRSDPDDLRAPLRAALDEAATLPAPPAGATDAQAARARARAYLQAMRARLAPGREAPLEAEEAATLRAEAVHLAAALLAGVLGEAVRTATPEDVLARLEADAGRSTAFAIDDGTTWPEVAGWAAEVDVQAGTLVLAHGADLDVATVLAAVRAAAALAAVLEPGS